jgi:hypothetical protein
MTPGIDTLSSGGVDGARVLWRKIRRFKPSIVALVGVTLFRSPPPARRRTCVARPAGGGVRRRARLRAPNPSGRNANFSYAEMLAAFRALRRASRER